MGLKSLVSNKKSRRETRPKIIRDSRRDFPASKRSSIGAKVILVRFKTFSWSLHWELLPCCLDLPKRGPVYWIQSVTWRWVTRFCRSLAYQVVIGITGVHYTSLPSRRQVVAVDDPPSTATKLPPWLLLVHWNIIHSHIIRIMGSLDDFLKNVHTSLICKQPVFSQPKVA